MVRWFRQGGLTRAILDALRQALQWFLNWLSSRMARSRRALRVWMRVLFWAVRPRDPNNLFLPTDGAFAMAERGRVFYNLPDAREEEESLSPLLFAAEPLHPEPPAQTQTLHLLSVRKTTADAVSERTAQVNRRYSYLDVLSREIKRLREPEINQLSEVVRRLARKWLDPDEQFIQIQRRNRLDVNTTLRYNIPRYGGRVLQFKWATRERPVPQMTKPARILVIGDVSHSMVHYVSVVLYFFHMLNFRFQVESYVFSQQATHASPYLNGLGSFQEKVQRLMQNAKSWNAGTRFGSSLEEILDQAASILDPYTHVVIATDGKVSITGGEYEKIDQQMQRLKAKARDVIFLTPSVAFTEGARGNVQAEVLGSFQYDYHTIPIFGMGPPLWYNTLGQYADRVYLVQTVQHLIDMCEDLILASRD